MSSGITISPAGAVSPEVRVLQSETDAAIVTLQGEIGGVPTSRTITCTSPLRIDGGGSADLSANRTLTFVVGGNIAWGGFGITGISSLDNSGGTIAVGANATSQSFGRPATTAAFLGAVTVAGTSLLSDVVTVQKDALGTTKTVQFEMVNLTNSGTQVSPMMRFSAFNGGTRLNGGLQFEPQSTSRGLLVLYYGTGTGAPASTGTYFDSSSPNFGSAVVADAFVLRAASTVGFRFDLSANRGGMDLDGSTQLRLKAYNNKAIVFETGADTGGSGGVVRMTIANAGYVQFALPPVLPVYTVATVPSAATFTNGVIIVSNEAGGRTIATSDGTNWRRVSDGTVIS